MSTNEVEVWKALADGKAVVLMLNRATNEVAMETFEVGDTVKISVLGARKEANADI